MIEQIAIQMLTSSMLVSLPPYVAPFCVEDPDATHGEVLVLALPQSAASWTEARVVDARLAELVEEIAHTDRHLRDASWQQNQDYIEEADMDVALRMPRNVVDRRKGRLRIVSSRSQVVSPSPDELAHLDLQGEYDDR